MPVVRDGVETSELPLASFQIEQTLRAGGEDSRGPAMQKFWDRIRRRDVLNRRWSASLLLAGSVGGGAAFFLATLVGVTGDLRGNDMRYACFLDQRCDSERSYHAETVSEMVSKPNEPAAKLFYSFTVIASICLIISKYPWELKNVYVDYEIGSFSLSSVRSLVPPCGMMLVAQVPVVPRPERINLAISISCQIHTFGAVMFVFGYNALEALSLKSLWKKLGPYERGIRTVCVIGSSCCMIGFVFSGWLFANLDRFGLCCDDIYIDSVEGVIKRFNLSMDNTSSTYEYEVAQIRNRYGQKILSNSASHIGLTIKKAEFWAEELAGFFIIGSHFTIWYFCEARTVRIPAGLM